MNSLSPRSTISHYRIKELIARGGMGEVYKAVDPRLGRTVAIKIPTGSARQDEKAKRRFIREARAASRLSHPNICTIFEVGEEDGLPFIVMEYVEGPTLQEMLTRGPLPVETALKLAVQIADAIDESHRSGIIHRDLKPSNVMVTDRGRAMILDFGLAKRLRDYEDADAENPTIMQSVTTGATIIGTVSYMSPEQVRAQPLDARSDVFSFGILLYEMLTGVRPFAGAGQVEILHAILHDDPIPPHELRPEIDVPLSNLVMRTLQKSVEDRYQRLTDVKLDLWQAIKEKGFDFSGTTTAPTTGRVRVDVSTRSLTQDLVKRIAPVKGIASLGIVALVAAGVLWAFWPSTPSFDPRILSSLETTQVLNWKTELGDSAGTWGKFSSNGRSLVYARTQSGNADLWIKQVVGGELPIAGTLDSAIDRSPIFSPDDEQVAFLSNRGGQNGIWRIPRSGGTPELISTIETQGSELVAWSRDGKRIFFDLRSNLYELDIASGRQTQLTGFERDSVARRGFSLSRKEDFIAYVDVSNSQRDIWIMPLRGGEARRVTNDAAVDSNPVWHPDGKRVLYNSIRGGINQICLAFVSGGATPVQLTLLDVDCDLTDVSQDGSRILYSVTRDEADIWQMNLQTGQSGAVTSDVGVEFWPDISRDGKMVTYQAANQANLMTSRLRFNVLARPLAGGGQAVISTDGYSPQWSPDGQRIAYLRIEKVRSSLWVANAGGGTPLRLSADGVLFGGFSALPFNRYQNSDFSWSPDGRQLVFSDGKSVHLVNADGSGELGTIEGADDGSMFLNPIWSPDGGRIAVQSRTGAGKGTIRSGVWLIENGRRTLLYDTERRLRLVGWASGGRGLVVKSFEPRYDFAAVPVDVEVQVIPVDGSTPQPVATLSQAYLCSFQLSRDGKLLAWVDRPDKIDTIEVRNIFTNKVQSVARGDDQRSYLAALSWAPDAKTIFYSKHSNTRAISMIDHFK